MDLGSRVYCLAAYFARDLEYLFNFCRLLMKYT